MSFILDALRKSESDRQERSTAEFASVPTGGASPAAPRWLWVLATLLAINLAVLLGVLLRPDGTQAPRQPERIGPAAVDTETAAVDAPARQPSFAERVAAAREQRPERETKPASTTAVDASAAPTQPDRITPESSDDRTTIQTSERYPSIHELRANGANDIPELHIDIHVYGPTPEERFVFINMSKLREGEQLDEGPVVAEITHDGVVLGHKGRFFLLPRE